MNGVWYLARRHALHNPVQSVVLVLCFAVCLFLPAATGLLLERYQSDLTARADSTPLVAGSKGNRFDLVLAALYYRQSDLEPLPWSQFESIRESGLGLAIPLNVRFTARGVPIVGVSADYFGWRSVRAQQGTLPLQLGDCVVGSRAAARLSARVGGALFSDQRDVYNISKPPALKMRVAGVLAPSGTPDDDAVFVDIKTCWILEGVAHGHDDPARIDRTLLLGDAPAHKVVSEAMIEYNEVTPANIGSFHIHSDLGALPLSAVLVAPPDEKALTLLKARVNASAGAQMIVPRAVVDDLMAFVFRIKALFDTLAGVLAACTALMTVLVVMLSLRARARERLTLHRIGCSRFTVARLIAGELLAIFACSAGLAAGAVAAAMLWLPDLVRAL